MARSLKQKGQGTQAIFLHVFGGSGEGMEPHVAALSNSSGLHGALFSPHVTLEKCTNNISCGPLKST